jgi:hypothetical protein
MSAVLISVAECGWQNARPSFVLKKFRDQNRGLRDAHLGVCYRRGGKPKWKFGDANLSIGGLRNRKRQAGVSDIPSIAIHIVKFWNGKRICKTMEEEPR